MFDKLVGWEFLDEPAYKWFIFLGMLMLMLVVWRGVVNAIKG